MPKTLRTWRLEKLLSLDDLAALAGVSNKTLVQLEHGRQAPRLRTMRSISAALDVEARDVEEFAAALDELQGDRD